MDELKVILLNNVDNLDLDFFEGENTWEFDIDDYSFTVVYSFDESTYYDADNDDDIDTGSKLTLISISQFCISKHLFFVLVLIYLHVVHILYHYLQGLFKAKPNAFYIQSIADVNSLKALFLRKTPKEVFVYFYNKIKK